jgi:hypothetical protein
MPPMRFSFAGDGRVSDHEGQTAGFSVAGSTMTFHRGWSGRNTWFGGPAFFPKDARFVFGALLTGTVQWSIDGNGLTISKRGVGALTFATQVTTALNGQWTLAGFGTYVNDTRTNRPAEGAVHLTIADGTMAASMGCDEFGGGIRLAGRTATFDRIQGATHSCPAPLPNQHKLAEELEPVLHDVFHGAARYKITGEDLTFTKPGVGQLEFRRSR